MKKFIVLMVLLTFVMSISAQMQRNCIYVIDCTKSMSGYNGTPDIWEPTKKNLCEKIEKEPPGTRISVIPFQNTTYPAITFERNEFNWKKVNEQLDKLIENVTNTNITDAWKSGVKLIDPNRNNYLYLMTDGGESGGSARLEQELRNFCMNAPENAQGFYVRLTKNATMDVNLRNVFEDCDKLFVVNPDESRNFGGIDDGSGVVVNTHELPVEVTFGFSDLGDFRATVENPMPHLKVSVKKGKISGGYVTLVFENAYGNDLARLIQEVGTDRTQFTLRVKSSDCLIVNPDIDVILVNTPESVLKLGGLEGDGTFLGESSQHDVYWWSKASEPDTMRLDLKPLFNEESVKQGGRVKMKILPRTEESNCTLLFNGEPLGDGTFIIDSHSPEAVLAVVMDLKSGEGDLGWTIEYDSSTGVERINNSAADDFEYVITAEHSIGINPLKLAVYIIAGIIVAALLLWFLVLRRIVYTKIRGIKVMTVTDPIFMSKRIGGAIKVVISPKRTSQGIVSRIFKGREIHIVSDVFESECTLSPRGKKVRFSSSGYMPSPSMLMEKMNNYELIPKNGGKSIKIEFN